jgi:hypothetical protein
MTGTRFFTRNARAVILVRPPAQRDYNRSDNAPSKRCRYTSIHAHPLNAPGIAAHSPATVILSGIELALRITMSLLGLTAAAAARPQ